MNTCSISRIEDLITSLISSSEISNQIFFIDKDVAFTYKDLHSKLEEFEDHLDLREIQPGTITAFRGSFDFLSIATLLFLLRKKTIVSLLPEATAPDTIKQPPVSHCLQFRDEVLEIEKASTHQDTPHPLVSQLLRKQESGLIFWSSGTTGQPKAVLHSFESFSRRFENKPRPVRTAAFMVFDHVGGIYNVLNCLYAKGTLVRIHDKTPTALGYLVEKERIEFLPLPASYLNLLALLKPWEKFDFSSLKYVVFGTERVSERSLAIVSNALPHVHFHQNFGMTEIGLMRSRPSKFGPGWIEPADDLVKVRVIDGILQIKTDIGMIGYLHQEVPKTEDGWLITGDIAEEKNGAIRVLGRATEQISVGGLKVSPHEVEDVLLQFPLVQDALVTGRPNTLLGQSIHALISMPNQSTGTNTMEPAALRRELRLHCQKNLERYKIPSQFDFTDASLTGSRLKKVRRSE